MNTGLVLASSALMMGAAGIAGSFLPHEILAAAGVAPAGPLPLLVQLLAALLFAFAMLNWTARGSLVGGIYNRPVTIGNLTHFMVGALALIKASFGAGAGSAIVAAAVIHSLFALAFARIFLKSPVQQQ